MMCGGLGFVIGLFLVPWMWRKDNIISKTLAVLCGLFMAWSVLMWFVAFS